MDPQFFRFGAQRRSGSGVRERSNSPLKREYQQRSNSPIRLSQGFSPFSKPPTPNSLSPRFVLESINNAQRIHPTNSHLKHHLFLQLMGC
ncbi:hypothetical protein RchiOBHm_Chr3g0448631 [Rosa chinensis]|uniref:Uncharacterized protein n=1 Tax=Rosa chinensis TaxID=74649 RepID=A0A2P6R589_ROSCH|nr:hypothetical protein RchiOBHm_Chr3g0448631 [Rosa chinensis]